ncbi:TetR/AcrR family transcriptional regulator [Saccharothrix australiensis]|uniref:TetR family transcriptional regulator n=1 Tax=Saccharothrix australiensis TaxID=2072 RepID=A0A495W1P6_9PSEU|nr:TetR/AcrR family transcriptional regulator [Saccharothrix australiensis]RKT54643.1 TetR family transcriptional regulator [Saccharothrix australiensis]
MEESRRERKKQQVRKLLVETAMRLFAEQGFERTTVAQIAEAADVAPKTFFNHFPTKDDVLFADAGPSDALAAEVIAARRPEDTVADVLRRTYEALRHDYVPIGGRDPETTALHGRLLTTVPSLQARALQRSLAFQRELAQALLAAFPDRLDPISAAAVVGALAGATQAAALRSMELGQDEQQLWAAMDRGVRIALHGLPEPDTEPTSGPTPDPTPPAPTPPPTADSDHP